MSFNEELRRKKVFHIPSLFCEMFNCIEIRLLKLLHLNRIGNELTENLFFTKNEW